jgi:hypothetical protein
VLPWKRIDPFTMSHVFITCGAPFSILRNNRG